MISPPFKGSVSQELSQVNQRHAAQGVKEEEMIDTIGISVVLVIYFGGIIFAWVWGSKDEFVGRGAAIAVAASSLPIVILAICFFCSRRPEIVAQLFR